MLRNVFKQALTESHVRDNIIDISTVALLLYSYTYLLLLKLFMKLKMDSKTEKFKVLLIVIAT